MVFVCVLFNLFPFFLLLIAETETELFQKTIRRTKNDAQVERSDDFMLLDVAALS